MVKETRNKVIAPDATSNPGLAVDAGGNPVIDPTKNVLDLVDASERRTDDLMAAAEKLSAVKHQHSRDLIELNSQHSRELREAETKRLDAIRAVDTAAAKVLADQVASSASTLRELVATTAEAAARAAAGVYNPLADRVAQLERTSYEGSGKAAVADPAMARMAEAVEALRANMSKGEGGTETRQEGRASIGMIVGIVGGVVGVLMFIVTIAINAFQ